MAYLSSLLTSDVNIIERRDNWCRVDLHVNPIGHIV